MYTGAVAASDKAESVGSYPGGVAPLRVPRTPLESRQGAHPKKDVLIWKTPPSRQLSREKRVEYTSDVRERFYDDYIGQRSTGDVGAQVSTALNKLTFDPSYYRANALQGLVYDPARVVPQGVDLHGSLAVERIREKRREMEHQRQRRFSDSSLSARPPSRDYFGQQTTQETRLPKIGRRPKTPLQQSMDDSLAPEIVPGVEKWLSSANRKEQEVANRFFETLSSHGKRPDPAAKAALHKTRVRSAVMTPSRREREMRAAQNVYGKLAKEAKAEGSLDLVAQNPARKARRRSSSGPDSIPKGSLFVATKQLPSHFSIHPDWSSEGTSSKRK